METTEGPQNPGHRANEEVKRQRSRVTICLLVGYSFILFLKKERKKDRKKEKKKERKKEKERKTEMKEERGKEITQQNNFH